MSAAQKRDLHIVLVEPEIPWNTGNIGRTCLALGATLHLVHPLGFDVDDTAVRRAGLDYWPSVDLRLWESWQELESRLGELGTPWLFSSEAVRSLDQVDLRAPAALIFGAEAEGLPAEIRKRHRERLVRIPMRTEVVRSLNLSVAVAVAGYAVGGRSPSLP